MRCHQFLLPTTRRSMLQNSAAGFGSLALAGLAGQNAVASDQSSNGSNLQLPHIVARAKRVIFLFMNGGPSHVDTFDPKAMLTKYHGQPLPYSNLPTERKTGTCYKSPFQFKKYGQSGMGVSENVPHTA